MTMALHQWLRQSPATLCALVIAGLLIAASVLAPWIAPHNPFDLSQLDLMDASNPPAWESGGSTKFLLGTDNQGRDVLSAILFGMRLSLAIGALSIVLALALGIAVGLLAGYAGGFVDQALMRIADVQLSFPTILIALTIDGLARAFLSARGTRRPRSACWCWRSVCPNGRCSRGRCAARHSSS